MDNINGDLDTAPGAYGIEGPDICHDACALQGTEHTEDACIDLPVPARS
jgi:hypothetical protein